MSFRRQIVGATRAVLSAGPGYEPQPRNRNASFDRPRGYFLDLRAKTLRPEARIVSGRGEDQSASPTALAQRALGWYECLLCGEAGGEENFRQAVDALLQAAIPSAISGRDALLWPYNVEAPKYGLKPPWFSAMAQGQAASTLVRAYSISNDERLAAAAKASLLPLLSVSPHNLCTATADGPVLEEYPSAPSSSVLNGWIFALWGLWDVWRELGDDGEAALFADSAAALEHRLDRFDTGWWSLYSLYPIAGGDLAKPFYHRLHIDQLEVMSELTGTASFRSCAARWRGYDTPIAVPRVIGSKLVGALS